MRNSGCPALTSLPSRNSWRCTMPGTRARTWAMRDYVKGFVFSPIRFTGEIDLYPLWIEA